jgi:hypothetical protein
MKANRSRLQGGYNVIKTNKMTHEFPKHFSLFMCWHH